MFMLKNAIAYHGNFLQIDQGFQKPQTTRHGKYGCGGRLLTARSVLNVPALRVQFFDEATKQITPQEIMPRTKGCTVGRDLLRLGRVIGTLAG